MEVNLKSKRMQNWMAKYQLLKEYYNEHGNIDVPNHFQVNGVHLGEWLRSQRVAYNKKGKVKITSYQIQLLNDLGMKWSFREECWDDNYYLLEEYYNEHGDIDVPKGYRINGVHLGE